MINLSGPGGDYEGALLTFAADAIPRPETMEMVAVTLIQNDYPPATVQAFNYSIPDLPFGVISFAVPTIDTALVGMEDVYSPATAIYGQCLFECWEIGQDVPRFFRSFFTILSFPIDCDIKGA